MAGWVRSDYVARLLAPRAAERLGQGIVVENRTGGGGTLGAAVVARAEPDGYTLLWDGFPHVVNSLLVRSLPFDYAAFAPITLSVIFPVTVAVKANGPYMDIAAFIAGARARPGSISAGHPANASTGRMLLERLRLLTGAQLNIVPYRGAGDAARDLAAGTLDSAMLSVSTVAQLEEAGRARILAVATTERVPIRPNVPTLIEAGVPVAMSEMGGLLAPAGTPEPILDQLNGAFVSALADADVRARLDQGAILPVGSTRLEFGTWITRTRAEVADLVREAGIQVE